MVAAAGAAGKPRSTSAVVRSLYRACLRWTRQGLVRRSRFQCGNLPSELAALDLPIELLTNADGVRETVRAAFRKEASLRSSKVISEKIDLGFQALRYLNEFTRVLEEVERKREENRNRDNIAFRIGQVVRHKGLWCRGVIVGWDRRPTVDVSRWDGVGDTRSLGNQPFYHVIPDESDANFQGVFRRLTYWAQENLELINHIEARVQNPAISSCFHFFDEATCSFVPLDHISYQYPADLLFSPHHNAADQQASAAAGGRHPSRRRSAAPSNLALQQAKAVDASRRMDKLIRKVGMQLCADIENKYGPLDSYQQPVRGILDCLLLLGGAPYHNSSSSRPQQVAWPMHQEPYARDRAMAGRASPPPLPAASPWPPSSMYHSRGQLADGLWSRQAPLPPALAKTDAGYRSLSALHELFRGSEDLWTRRSLSQNRDGVLFGVGQVVRHKTNGFVGVVAGWERPAELLSLKDNSLPKLPPSYRLIVNELDRTPSNFPPSAVAFVPQEELEKARDEDCASLVSPLIPESFEHYDPELQRYYPNATLRWQFPLDMVPRLKKSAEERERERRAEKIVAMVVKGLRRLVDYARKGNHLKDDLLLLLRHAKRKSDATAVEGLLWHCWLAHPDENVRALMDDGLFRLASGRLDEAILRFSEVIKQDPTFAEAYNVRGRAHFLAGRYHESMSDINKTLEWEKYHFGALLGKGLSYFYLDMHEAAVRALQDALRIHPWATGVGTTLQLARKVVEEQSWTAKGRASSESSKST